MVNGIFEQIYSGFIEMLNYVDWLFVATFIISTWLINTYTFRVKNKSFVISKSYLILIWGLILSILFYILFRDEGVSGKEYFKSMFFSIIFSMVSYKLGIDKFFNYIETKIFKNVGV